MMKTRTCIFWLLTIFCFISCSKGDDGSNQLNRPDGQYIFRNDTILVFVSFSNGTPYVLNTFIRGGSVCQLRNLTTSGEYPQMNISYSSYPSEEFQMAIKFIDIASFNASVSVCKLEKGNWAGYYAHKNVVLPKQMNFKQDNTVLDKNGDGILDSTQ